MASWMESSTSRPPSDLCGGVFSAGPKRLDGAALAGVPQVVAPGCLDMVNFAAPDAVPARYAKRKLFHWNPNVTLMRTNVEENEELGRILAAKINQSTGPVKVLLPLRGVSQLDSFGGEFWWPEADQALFHRLQADLRADIPVIALEANINDPAFADRAAKELLELMRDRTSNATAPSLTTGG